MKVRTENGSEYEIRGGILGGFIIKKTKGLSLPGGNPPGVPEIGEKIRGDTLNPVRVGEPLRLGRGKKLVLLTGKVTRIE